MNVQQKAQEVAQYGRGGDTMLAHITPEEAQILRFLGGAGTTNPNTGLPEFFKIRIGKKSSGLLGSVIGYALGGPVGAAIGSGLATKASGGSDKEALLSAGLSYAGGSLIGGLGGAGTSEASFLAADAAQLANQGLSQSQIAQTLAASGVDSFVAADAANLAAQGLGADQIATVLGQQTLTPTAAKSPISIQQALQGARLATGLMQPEQQESPNMLGRAQEAMAQQGGVDYSNLLALLSQRASTAGLLGTRFQPQPINIASLLG